jgi:sarcosine oxidase
MDADAVVIEAGSTGSVASWQLAQCGLRVVGIDRFPVPWPCSAHRGKSRLFGMSGWRPGTSAGRTPASKMASSLGAVVADLFADGTTATGIG